MSVPITASFLQPFTSAAGSRSDAGGGDAGGFHQLIRSPGAGQAAHSALPDPQRLAGPGERLEHGGAEAALGVVVLGDDQSPAGRHCRGCQGGLVERA